MSEPFWRRKRLEDMTPGEWESLCDGCARCCLLKLEDEDTGEIDYTCLSCKLLDDRTCRCRHYEMRRDYVPDCVPLTPESVRTIRWLPLTCAYRLVAEGRDLYWWHPLVSGDPETVVSAGISVRGRTVPEEEASEEDWEDYFVDWPAQDYR
ncbi:MAG: YcgN family cysteine cluster protein [Flavobacteriaceae bacterium]